MGFLDKFKRNSENNIPVQKEEKLPFDIKYSLTDDKKLQIDFLDRKADFKKGYDTTRLIINSQPMENIYNCSLSWYGENDCMMLDERGEFGRRIDYSGILAQIDFNLLQTDKNYCYFVMKNLLEKHRIEEYIQRGLSDTPDYPCGKYIGGMIKDKNR